MPTITPGQFNGLLKYGRWCSFAVWRSWQDVSDTSMINPGNIGELSGDFVLIGLNPSRSARDDEPVTPFKNFHSDSPRQKDFKLCYALMGTRLWGSYMTDLFKSFCEPRISDLKSKLKERQDLVSNDISTLKKELEILGGRPVLVAIGRMAEDHLRRLFPDFRVVRITHYSDYHSNSASKENYRELVHEQLREVL